MVILSKFLSLFVASLIFPFFVMPAIRLVCGFFPKYKDIYPISLYPLAIYTFLIDPIVSHRGALWAIAGQIIYVCIFGFWLGFLQNPLNEEAIGFKKGALATLLLSIFAVMLFAVFFMVIVLVQTTGE